VFGFFSDLGKWWWQTVKIGLGITSRTSLTTLVGTRTFQTLIFGHYIERNLKVKACETFY